jgi:hypothetical protein
MYQSQGIRRFAIFVHPLLEHLPPFLFYHTHTLFTLSSPFTLCDIGPHSPMFSERLSVALPLRDFCKSEREWIRSRREGGGRRVDRAFDIRE